MTDVKLTTSERNLQTLERILDRVLGVQLVGREGTMFWHRLQDAGFKTLGMGGTRMVVDIGDGLVAKIDSDENGSTNWAEHELWSEMGEELPLAPVIDMRAEGRILIMPLAKPTFDKRVPRKYAAELESGMDTMFQALPSHEDYKWQFNWGVINGQALCFDYAS